MANGTLVIPYEGTRRADVGVRDGCIVAIQDRIAPADADRVVDATGRHVFPGAVDSHFHLGIYRPLAEDVGSETASAVAGGVTTVVSYFRTGQHYLNKSGPYREIYPEVLATVAGRAHTDYGFHIAVMTAAQLDEVPWLVDQGVGSFKYYMFYRGMDLVGRSGAAGAYTMAESYDLGHLYRLMERVADAAHAQRNRGRVSLSVHCENADLIRVFMEDAKRAGLRGLEAWHRARPPLSERLSIAEATLLADAAGCPVNLLHLSSADALAAATEARSRYPGLDVRAETTLHHLALTVDQGGVNAKVNPPIRTKDDVEALWRGVASGEIDTVASDHACCMSAEKGDDVWSALLGFGGTALLYPILISEGHHRRGVALARIAELASATPARLFGLAPRKGALAVGADADLAIVELDREREVTVEALHSAQDHTPFAGMRVRGWPTQTVLRGEIAYDEGKVAPPRGEYVKRPAGTRA